VTDSLNVMLMLVSVPTVAEGAGAVTETVGAAWTAQA
jgi:hypothetical protein